MHLRRPRETALSALAALSLAMLTLLAGSGSPPDVDIAEVPGIDGGEEIRILGIVVEAWSSDTGYLSVVVANLNGGCTLKVVCSEGVSSTSPGVRIGDEIRVTGEVGVTGGGPVLWSTLDDIEILRSSCEVLDLDMLVRSWRLLVDDRFEIVGILTLGPDAACAWLTCPDGSVSIALRAPGMDLSRFENRQVRVEAVLRLEPDTMGLALVANAVSANA